MIIIHPSVEILTDINGEKILKTIEEYGRVCYKSEEKITEDSAHSFVKNILRRGHLSVIEHVSISVRIICDRGVSHEIVRHRIASYSQESTRYCNYGNTDIQFIAPVDMVPPELNVWMTAMTMAEQSYKQLISFGVSPQTARSVLPNSLKTELIMTANLREWQHFLRLRTSQAAHPQMRSVANMILSELKCRIPIIFDDI